MMAGFGAAAPNKSGGGKGKKTKAKAVKAASSLSPKKQWERFKDHRNAGVPVTPVFARVQGSDNKWLEVGDVTASGCEISAAVQAQKRIILEHAVRVHPVLQPKARELECGYSAPETVLLQKTPPADISTAGFVGRADASGRYGKTENEINEIEPTSLKKATGTVGQTKSAGTAGDSKGRIA